MNDFKKQLVNMMAPGDHKHLSLTDASLCKKCQPKILKAKALYDREIRRNPMLIQRSKPVFKPSAELEETHGQLVDRVKHDKLYRDHLLKSQYGTIEEQNKEADLANSGYYTKHSDYQGIRFI